MPAYWMTAWPPMTRYLTTLSLKSFNRSVKSELTNIDALDFAGMDDQLPSRSKSGLGSLGLPECQVE